MILGSGISGVIQLDVKKLVETRMLIQANSGGGKTHSIRRILEETHGQVQQIVIDVEGEYHTLREKFEYVIAGAGGDCPAHPGSAQLLARRLLELGVSCIIDIFELKSHERIRFVRLFLEAMINAEKSLWHPCIVVVDEAHIFCPQTGSAESAGAVIDLMTRGRKRGFCGILATQRIAKLHKDASAEANNKLIGRCSQDVDMKRAADDLGFTSREDTLALRMLERGQFHGFGPAFNFVGVSSLMVGPIKTSPPKPGEHSRTRAPGEKVKAVLSKLADLPKEAEQELKTVAELQQQIRELKKAQPKPGSLTPATKDALNDAYERGVRHAQGIMAPYYKRYVGNVTRKAKAAQTSLAEILALVPEGLSKDWEKDYPFVSPKPEIVSPKTSTVSPKTSTVSPKIKTPTWDPEDNSLGSSPRKILNALAQAEGGTLTKNQLALRSGFAMSGSFRTYLSSLRTKNCIEYVDISVQITDTGREILGDVEPLPQGDALFEYWSRWLGVNSGPSRILQVLDSNPSPHTAEELAAASGFELSGSFRTYLSKLRTLQLISKTQPIEISASLIG